MARSRPPPKARERSRAGQSNASLASHNVAPRKPARPGRRPLSSTTTGARTCAHDCCWGVCGVLVFDSPTRFERGGVSRQAQQADITYPFYSQAFCCHGPRPDRPSMRTHARTHGQSFSKLERDCPVSRPPARRACPSCLWPRASPPSTFHHTTITETTSRPRQACRPPACAARGGRGSR